MNYELPNKELIKEDSITFDNQRYYHLSKLLLKKDLPNKLMIPIGIDKNKNKYYIDLQNTTGIFISGETGSGKSVFIDALITSLLLKNTPDELNFLLIDPCKVELQSYQGIPHLTANIYTKEFEIALQNVARIMDERRNQLVHTKHKNISSYNEKNIVKMPHLFLIIDGGTDFIKNTENKKILETILRDGCRLGIHLILATSAYLQEYFDQNFLKLFTYILSFDLASEEQAKFIQLTNSNLLMVAGEALIKSNNKIDRIQTPYISNQAIKKVVDFIKKHNYEYRGNND